MFSPTLASLRDQISTLDCQSLGLIDYEEALKIQRQVHQAVVEGKGPSCLLLLQHPAVFTAGRRTLDSERPIDGSKVIDVDRGGKITFHGPGQIVGYPIVRLKRPNDVVGFVRQIERALIQVCQDFSLNGQTYCQRSGVWIRDEQGDRKIAAIGIRVAKGVTMHGFALNVSPDLSYFDRIIPCGIPDATVTSMQKELNQSIELERVLEVVEARMKQSLMEVCL
ncbi:MAG: lipoyl(octanoyl) transferase LipB [Actinobacteria bacterium]|nr:lipoyl(octanoyl) transferase LipB [Actinomycetota bacterium]